jgi:hypothetical protein
VDGINEPPIRQRQSRGQWKIKDDEPTMGRDPLGRGIVV